MSEKTVTSSSGFIDNPTGIEQTTIGVTHDREQLSLKQIYASLVKWVKFLLRKWVYLLLTAVIGGLLGFVISLFIPVTYTTNLKFILEEGKAGGGGLSAIAGQFGLDLGSMSSQSSILAGDNIIGLLKSKRFTVEVLTTTYDSSTGNSLADKYAEVYELRKKWRTDPSIGKDIFFPVNHANYTRLQDSLLSVIVNKILTKHIVIDRVDKKMTFFGVSVTLKDELLAKYFTERLVSNTIDFYIETKTRRQRKNVDRLQLRANELLAMLNSRTYSAAAAQSQILDVNPAYSTATVSAELSTRDKTVTAAIYAEIVKNLEIQRVTLTQETPVIQVVDGADLPLKKNKASIPFFIVIGSLTAAILCVLGLSVRRAFQREEI